MLQQLLQGRELEQTVDLFQQEDIIEIDNDGKQHKNALAEEFNDRNTDLRKDFMIKSNVEIL